MMREMKVLILGMPRTGTQSLADALPLLGVGPIYHMREVMKNDHQNKWVKAYEAKYEGKGKSWGREEFDTILGDFEGLSDIPAVPFYTELMKAYPDAKIILSIRSEDSWYASSQKNISLFNAEHAPPTDPPHPMQDLRDLERKHFFKGDLKEHGREVFRSQNDGVRECARYLGREVLEYEVGMGWEPLCKFLGVDVPEVDYPNRDDARR